MEFNEKLQELRKKKGLTQEALAELLFVSRTAVSKWESGRGYPSIDSLKALAKLFSVTVDELLSGDELLTIAEENSKQKETHFRDLVFGLLDCSIVMFFFLPFFGQKADGAIHSVSLLALTEVSPWLQAAYYFVIIGLTLWGVLILGLQNCQRPLWVRCKSRISLVLNTAGVLLFIISLQPYAAVFMFTLLAIKGILLVKKQ